LSPTLIVEWTPIPVAAAIAFGLVPKCFAMLVIA